MNKQKPSGTIPFDYEWTVGESGLGTDLSPYPRVNRLLKYMQEQEYTVDAQRALLITEAYKANEGDSVKTRWAKAYKHVLENVNINIYPDELIVGEIAAPMKSAPIFPEIAYAWIEDELLNHPWEEREVDPYHATPETKEQLLSIADYWRDKSMEVTAISRFDAKEAEGSHLQTSIYFLNLYLHGGVGHTSINYEKLFSLGYDGVRKQIEDAIAALDKNASDYT